MEKEKKPSCQACWHTTTERLTPVDDEYNYDVCGIDYQYRCKIHDMVVPRDYYCDKFELPF